MFKMNILEDFGNPWIHTEEIIKTLPILKKSTKSSTQRYCGNF